MAASTSAAAPPAGLVGPRPAAPARCCTAAAAPACQPLARRRGSPRRRLAVAVLAGKRISEADMYTAVPPPQPQAASPLAGQPLYVTVPVALLGLVAALRTAKAVKKAMSGGNRLEERGFKKGGVADDRAYTRAIKGMRKMQYEELSDEQIEAARRRRRREVEKDALPLDLEQIELPENHPFAVKKKLAPEEEAMQRNRLLARRGLSPEDMQRLREQQALADQMDAQEEARRAARGR